MSMGAPRGTEERSERGAAPAQRWSHRKVLGEDRDAEVGEKQYEQLVGPHSIPYEYIAFAKSEMRTVT